jgi:hypothetical protein
MALAPEELLSTALPSLVVGREARKAARRFESGSRAELLCLHSRPHALSSRPELLCLHPRLDVRARCPCPIHHASRSHAGLKLTVIMITTIKDGGTGERIKTLLPLLLLLILIQ